MWVVYDRPADAPATVVVRKWLVEPGKPEPLPTDEAREFLTVEEARLWCDRQGLYALGRMPGDEPQIVDVWI